MACAYHYIHTEEGTQQQRVELALLMGGICTTEPFVGLHHKQQGTAGEYCLHKAYHGAAIIHPAEEFNLVAAVEETHSRVQHQQQTGYGMEIVSQFSASHKVVYKYRYKEFHTGRSGGLQFVQHHRVTKRYTEGDNRKP